MHEKFKQEKVWSKNIEKLDLAEDTPVYCITTNQILFFDRPANRPGMSKIKGSGIIENYELRKPTEEEIEKWTKDYTPDEPELVKFRKDLENWNNISFNQKEVPKQEM